MSVKYTFKQSVFQAKTPSVPQETAVNGQETEVSPVSKHAVYKKISQTESVIQPAKNAGTMKKFAMGYFFVESSGSHTRFMPLVRQYHPYLYEIYFPWPWIGNARESHGDAEKKFQHMLPELLECRQKYGLKLDLLANATCYKEDAMTEKQHKDFIAQLSRMKECGLLPDILTTTSPYLANITRRHFPEIETRASVNMRLNSTLAIKYVSENFDSFYICRDIQRDLGTVRHFSDWAKKNGKKMCMLVNSGCLRYCPWQTFHEMLLSHNYMKALNETNHVNGLQPVLCANLIAEKKYEEILRGSWIRPEDLRQYEPYAEVFKLSTREVDFPDLVLKAYTSRDYDGDLNKIIDPGFHDSLNPYIFSNKLFPKEWSEGKIAGSCANNCTHCGKCTEVLNKVMIRDENAKPVYSFKF